LYPTLPHFNFDYENMRRSLINLIDNSLASIEEKGSGKIETSVQNGRAILHHHDSGNGIPEEIRQKIFEPYFSTKKSGMGLGLAIVKRIVEEHKGTISVESEKKGTNFTIELRLDDS